MGKIDSWRLQYMGKIVIWRLQYIEKVANYRYKLATFFGIVESERLF